MEDMVAVVDMAGGAVVEDWEDLLITEKMILARTNIWFRRERLKEKEITKMT